MTNNTIYVTVENGIAAIYRFLDQKGWFEKSNDGAYRIPYDQWVNKTDIRDVYILNQILGNDNFFVIKQGVSGLYIHICNV